MPSFSFVCVVLAESSLLMKLFLVVSAGFLLTAAETQGGDAAMQARDQTLDQTLLSALNNKANCSKVHFPVSLFSAAEV